MRNLHYMIFSIIAILALSISLTAQHLVQPIYKKNQFLISTDITADQQYKLNQAIGEFSNVNAKSVDVEALIVEADLSKNADVQFRLGTINEDGLYGVRKNLSEAVKWYGVAIINNHAGAKYRLGLIQQPAGGVLAEDAYRLFRSASFQGYPLAMLEQAKAHHKGIGTRVNHYSAAHWYKMAISSGVMEANLGLGELYLVGKGVKKDVKKGLDHLLIASAAGIPEAQYKLGMVYYLGMGVDVDPIQADRWLREALKHGVADAIQPLTMIKVA